MHVTSTRNIISSYDNIFDEIFSSTLAYTSRPYLEAMAMFPAVKYTSYATSSKEKTGNIITFGHFEEWNILYETCDCAESGDKSYEN